MRRRGLTRHAVSLTLIMLLFVTSQAMTGLGHAVSSSNLSVASSGTVFTASRNNTLTIEISNVGKYVRELDVTLTIPPPLVLFGDNHWIRSTFAPGQLIRANLTVFAPSSAAGTTLQGSLVAVYKLIGETVLSTETHAISFLVRGWIDIKVYEVTVDPNPCVPGSEITISGNLLNRGVIAAMYTNVTIAEDQPVVKESVKPTYVGQVDPNAPAPFSVTAVIDSAATQGNYEATIYVYYRDDLQLDHAVSIPVGFAVVSELPKTQTTTTTVLDQLLSNELFVLGLVVIVILVIIGVVIRRRRRPEEA